MEHHSNHSKTYAQVTALRSFLLSAGLVCDICLLARDNLPQHDHTVTVHEGNTRKTLAILESVSDEWLLRLEGALCHLIRLQRVWVFHFLATSFFAHLPSELGDAARRAAASHKANWRVANLDFVGDVQDLDLRSKLFGLSE